MIDLLPCPFCGSTDVEVCRSCYFLFVLCDGCGAQGPAVECDLKNLDGRSAEKANAVEAWNKRTLPLTGPFLPVADVSQIEADSITIGDKSGLHMVIDGQGQRLYDGDKLIRNA